MFGSNGRIVDNEVTGPWVNGGILLRAGANNVIAENEVSDVGAHEGPFDDNFGDGIFVGVFTAGTLLSDNLVEQAVVLPYCAQYSTEPPLLLITVPPTTAPRSLIC